MPQCAGSCSAGTGLPDSGAVLTQNQSVTGDIEFSSPGTGVDRSEQTIDLYLFNPAVQTPGTTEGDPQSTMGPVRCDDGVPAEDTDALPVPGCVIADQVPTFVITSPEWKGAQVPLHAAFVTEAQNNPRTLGLGQAGIGQPLIREYLPDERSRNAKRRKVCGSFQRDPYPAGTSRDDRDSCDEYPYHSSRQGVPEFAVTGHVPLGQNRQAGNRLGQFYIRYHVGDGDPFFVQP